MRRLLACFLVLAATGLATVPVTVDFEDVAVGEVPAGWTVASTHPRGPLAAWAVTAGVPGAGRVLGVTPAPGVSGRTFNLCWTDGIRFRDGEITVRVRAVSGKEDQGGGPMWRVQDADNYYVARYNPLERNFRVYVVANGHRRMLDGASGLRIPAGRWFTIRIVQDGNHIQGFLDGTGLLDVRDGTFPEEGGVGLWTKADAATLFDDLVVRPGAP